MAKNIRQYVKTQYQHIKVLYVEDEVFSREKLLRVLNRRFTNVHVAIDGMEGYQLYQKYQPDLIIADIKMSQMSGLEMISKIRQENDRVQIIVTTAHDDNEYFIQSIENKVNHFILKPIDLEHFLLAIQKSIYHIQLENELARQKDLTRAILDVQDNLVFMIENDEIVEYNLAFAEFTGIGKKPEAVHTKYLARFFLEDPNYFYPKDPSKWVDELTFSGMEYVKVKWKGINGKVIIYYLKAAKIANRKQILMVCTNITELEAECKKNELLAMMDPLTNSYNRLKFDEILECEIRRSERYHHPFSIILMDIDDFKQVNDQFGHQKGDDVLITMSTIIQQRIRESDVFARWGGDEFMILTPETSMDGAKELAESIRWLIQGFAFPDIGTLTCSFGISRFVSGKSKRELVMEADQALYLSKNNGRNCVTQAAEFHD